MRRSGVVTATVLLLVPFGPGPARAYTAPTAARVVLLNSVITALPANDILQVTGEVRNDNAATLTQVPLRVRVFDAANALIGQDDTGALVENMAPGMTSAFLSLISPIPPGYDHYTVSVLDAPVASTLANTRFTTEVAGAVTGTDPYDGTVTSRVSGYVTNDNTGPADLTRVFAVYRDAAGAIADVHAATVDNPSDSAQDAGIKLQWEFTVYGDYVSHDAGLALSTFAVASNDPFPMRNDVGSRPSALLAYNATISPFVTLVKTTTNGYPANDDTLARLQRQSGSSWLNVASALSFGGAVGFPAQRPRVRAVYRVVTPASAATEFRASVPFVVQVRMLISAALSATSIHPTGYAYLSGKTSVAHAGQRVYLQRYYSGAWHTLTSKTLSSTSSYRFTLKPGRVGTFSYRVLKPTDTTNYQSASITMRLKVA